MRALAVDRHRAPGEDLLSTLVRAEEDGTKLAMDELVACVCMLLVAGNETTADLIATGLALLLAHPGQLDVLRTRPELIDSALHEVLRYEAPLEFSPRIAAEDIPLDGRVIPQGSRVFFGHGSGNRDPRQFDRAEQFDVTRNDKSHLAIAAGAHFCIGNQLAIAEGREFFTRMLERFPLVKLAGEPAHRTDRFFQHGYASVPIIVES